MEDWRIDTAYWPGPPDVLSDISEINTWDAWKNFSAIFQGSPPIDYEAFAKQMLVIKSYEAFQNASDSIKKLGIAMGRIAPDPEPDHPYHVMKDRGVVLFYGTNDINLETGEQVISAFPPPWQEPTAADRLKARSSGPKKPPHWQQRKRR